MSSGDAICQAFITAKGKKIVFINPRNKEVKINLPAEAKDATAEYVDESTGDNSIAQFLTGDSLTLQPYAVAVLQLK